MNMIKRLERLKNTFNKYMADLRPDRLTTYQSERKLVVSRLPGVYIRSFFSLSPHSGYMQCPSHPPPLDYSHSHFLFIPSIKYIDTGHVKSKYILIDAISIQKHHNKTITQWMHIITYKIYTFIHPINQIY
jgi:hypothetical protein